MAATTLGHEQTKKESTVENYKTCSKCKQTKPLELWGKNKSKKDGLASECKSCHKESSKTWRANNPEEQKRRSREQHHKNKETANAKRAERYLVNREQELQVRRDWYANNAEHGRELSRKWRKNNKQKYAAQWRRSRALRVAVRTEIYTEQDVLDKWGSNCHICSEPIDMSAPRWTGAAGWQNGLHLDHVLPIRAGGKDNLENVKPAHGLCNLRKG